MNLREKLETLMSEKHLTRAELAKQSGIPYTTIDGILKRNDFEKIKLTTLIKLKTFFDVTLDYLMDERITDKNFGKFYDFKVNVREQHIIEKYRGLSCDGQIAADKDIDVLIELEQSFQQATAADNVSYIPRHLPFYDMPVSAGTGVFLDSDNYELVETGPEVPAQTNFLLRVSGDSMEPKLQDGDVLYVKQQPSVEDGEIGVFYLDGNAYVKKMQHKGRTCYLISLNSNYAPIKVECEDFKCYGKVLN